MSEPGIREANSADVPILLTLIRELAEYERLSHEVVATDELLAAQLFGPERVAHALIAEQGVDVSGFALYFFTFSTFLGRPGLYLEDLFVRPAWRSQGVGRALLGALAARAVARGCGRMEWAVLNWNESAIRFYRSLGARPQDEWTVYRLTRPAIAALNSTARLQHVPPSRP